VDIINTIEVAIKVIKLAYEIYKLIWG